jgi:hypothetical protein
VICFLWVKSGSIDQIWLNYSISVNRHIRLNSLPFHAAFSPIKRKNWWLWLNKILSTSSCC